MDPTQLLLVCDNPECVYVSMIRTVRLPHLGGGIYAKPPLVCECGFDLRKARTPELFPDLLGDQVRREFDYVLEPPC